ncbi:hypothetical protein FACS1894217_05240 [Clostridia bacterium]|nr:hypothetical protein FACS1894217_05240 [Clostridia bacterium]
MEIRLSKDARKFLCKTDTVNFERISRALENLSKVPPMGDIAPYKGKPHTFRARIGKYRIIYRVNNDILEVSDIDSRGQVYK